jgi:hypothetical protein
MASETRTHSMCDDTFGNRRLGQVSMANSAGNARPEVRRMVELNVSAGGEPVYANPGNFEVLISVLDDLLDLRTIGEEFGVAEHALADGRDPRAGTSIGANVAIDATHPKLHVLVMGKRDRLLRPTCNGKQNEKPRGFA